MNTPHDFLKSNEREIVALETLLTSIPAIAPEGGGDGETKKAAALESWLRENGFAEGGCTIERFEAPDSRVSDGVRPSLFLQPSTGLYSTASGRQQELRPYEPLPRCAENRPRQEL